MAFFKKYNGTTNVRLLRMERIIWTLIYGGLLGVVLGMFVEKTSTSDATLFFLGGSAAVVVGVVLVFIRARLREED